MNSLLPLLVGHCIVEFVTVSSKVHDFKTPPEPKSSKVNQRIKALTHPVLVALVIAAMLVLNGQGLVRSVVAAACAAVLHNLIDRRGARLEEYLKLQQQDHKPLHGVNARVCSFAAFLLKQTTHLVSLYFVAWIAFPPRYLLTNLQIHVSQLLDGHLSVESSDRPWFIVLVLIVSSFVSSELLKIILPTPASSTSAPPAGIPSSVPASAMAQVAPSSIPNGHPGTSTTITTTPTTNVLSDDGARLGRWIGITERLMMAAMVVLGAWEGVGFVIAAKSMARLEQLKKPEFVEYYILGTMLSALIGIAAGVLLRGVIKVG